MSSANLKQVSFPPDVLARIAPDVSLQRHLSLGIRPNLRKFQEFNSIDIKPDNLKLQENYNNIFASSIIKSGSTTIINTLTLGVVENYGQSIDKYTSLYPVVEILRGRLGGAPTDEEMIIGQDLHETIYHSKWIPSESLLVKPIGLCVKEEDNDQETIYYPGLLEDSEYIPRIDHDKSYSFVILSSIKIYSKHTSTNSLFDLCYLSCFDTLQKLKLPRLYIMDSIQTKVSIKSKKSTTRGLISTNKTQLNIDTGNKQYYYSIELNIKPGSISSNYGVVANNNNAILLTDLQGQEEESAILSRMSIISNQSGTINKISLINGTGDISLELLRDAIEISKRRSLEGVI